MDNPIPIPTELPAARQRFDALVREHRAELHRYSSRLVGSAIDGEDVVQETLAKAYYQLSSSTELPVLRPWLFRVAYTTALDFMRRYDRRFVEPLEEATEEFLADSKPAPEIVRAALSSFVALPPAQRSAVILKDVLGYSLEEVAEATESTVPAIKSALVRGRGKLQQQLRAPEPAAWSDRPEATPQDRLRLQQYVSLFNSRNWDALRTMLSDESRLDMVSKSTRKGQSVGFYFTRYAQEPDVFLKFGLVEGRAGIGVYSSSSPEPRSVVLIDWSGDKVALIRDYYYVPYIAQELAFGPTG